MKQPRIGSTSASEIYSAVGEALSWWEAAEDELLGLYRTIQEDKEPAKLESYIGSTRGPRSQMMLSAMTKRASMFQGKELSDAQKAIAALNGLAARRNEISHGHCTKTSYTEDDVLLMTGHFLVPAWNEQIPTERNERRFALTAIQIKEFESAVRDARWVIFEIASAIRMRKQDAKLKAQGAYVFTGPEAERT